MTQSITLVPFIPDTAPFSAAQRAWLNGYLAGLFSQAPANAAQAISPTPNTKPALTILFGSQTGNAETLAKRTAKEAKKQGFAATVLDMAKVDDAMLTKVQALLVITSTYGEGEPPDNAAALHARLHSADATKLTAPFAVLALGDKNYAHFCQTGKDFDVALARLGAQRALPLLECDVDFDAAFAQWLSAVLKGLGEPAQAQSAATGEVEAPKEVPVNPAMSTSEARYSKLKPFPARVLQNINLHGDGAGKDTRHIALSLRGSGLRYEVGDALGVVPHNDPTLVAETIAALGFDARVSVTSHTGNAVSLQHALSHEYQITQLNKAHLEAVAERAPDAALLNLLKPENAEALKQFVYGRDVIDVLLQHPRAFETPQSFVDALKRLAPRLYSISSSQKAHPDEVHVTVGVVRYAAHGRTRGGVCSTMLARCCCEQAAPPVFIHTNKAFRLPEDGARPIIMVGPGTGIAPFRAFLQERQASGATGANWLFFGAWNATSDFLYEAELREMQGRGGLTKLDVAFSRDQAEKIYVQHVMQQQASELWRWLNDGAYFYVCGDAARMAKDVHAALLGVAQTAGGLSSERASEWVLGLQTEKRYRKDVY
jgi:sulfite reductase (NADPH) flavoprotein alpha-component